MWHIKICMLAVMGVFLLFLLRGWKSDLVPAVRLGFTILFAVMLLQALTPILSYLEELSATGGIESDWKVLLEALGIAFLTRITSDICRDGGENGLAVAVETAGKAEILLLALPLLQKLITAAKELMELGG